MDGMVEGWIWLRMDLWMDGIVEGWMEFSSGSVWRVAVVQSGEDLANLIRTHWHDHPGHHHHHCHHQQCDQQVAGKMMGNFAKVISIQVKTFFVKRVHFSGEVLQIYVLNQFQGIREEKATFNWTILATTAAECRRRRKTVATYRNIIKSWPDLPSIMMMIMMWWWEELLTCWY